MLRSDAVRAGRRRFIILTALGLANTATCTGYAQSIAPQPGAMRDTGAMGDAVHVRGGTLLRGTIIESVPGVRVRIRLTADEVATVPWAQIDRIVRSTPCSSAAASPAGAVKVHIVSPDPVDLQQSAGAGWKTVCASPCDLPLPLDASYRVVGKGLRASGEFSLEGNGGCGELEVHPASSGWHTAGIVLMSVSVPLTLVGLGVTIGGEFSAEPGPDVGHKGGDYTLAGVGFVIFALGATSMAMGLSAVIANATTDVTITGSEPSKTAAAGSEWPRMPKWREATPEQQAMPVPVLFSVLEARF
jgi:hypothetical protein